MANSRRPKVSGLALTVSIMTAAVYLPSPVLLKATLGFDFGLGAVTNKVMHPFGGGNKDNQQQQQSGDGEAAGQDGANNNEPYDPAKDAARDADKDAPKEESSSPAAGKKGRTQEIEIPMSPDEDDKDKNGHDKAKTKDGSYSVEDDPTLGKDVLHTKRVPAPENDSPEQMERDVSHPKFTPKRYYDDEGAEIEESEYYDEQEKKRKEKQLRELCAPAGEPADSDPEPHLLKAKELTKKALYKPALEELNEALRLQPQYWEAHYQGALIFQTMGREKDAIERYKYLLSRKPDYIEAHINLGVLLTRAGDFAAAEKEYKKALDLNFYSLSAHYNLANLFIKQEKLNPALAELKICVKLKPTNAWVHNNLGVIYQKRNYLEEAEEEFHKALSLEPANKSFESNLYLVRSQLKKKPPVRASKPVPAEIS